MTTTITTIQHTAANPAAPIDRARVTRTYNGSTGCACGCGGTYTDENVTTGALVTRRLNLVNANLDKVEVDYWGNETIYSYEYGEENSYGECRVTRIYVNNATEGK
jgi:hypothetical protein